MARNRYRLFYWLAIIGALSGYLLGELVLGSGNGLYVAPVAAVVGLLLAWALWSTRGRGESLPRPAPSVEPPAKQPDRQRTNNKVRVAKSQGGKRR